MLSFIKLKIRGYLFSDSIDKLLNNQSKILDQLSAINSVLRQDDKYKYNFWLYDNREERMDATNCLFNEIRRYFHLARYEFASKYCSGKEVADIACGTGYGTKLLVEKGGAKSVVGVDISAEAITYAANVHCNPCVTYLHASGTQTGLGAESFDIIMSFETIEHVPNDLDLLREFHRILKPGGILVCSTPNEWPIRIATHHVREYNRDSFCNLLNNYFKLDGLYNQNSGDLSAFNHGQPFGIIETTDENHSLAECFIAVCKKK